MISKIIIIKRNKNFDLKDDYNVDLKDGKKHLTNRLYSSHAIFSLKQSLHFAYFLFVFVYT